MSPIKIFFLVSGDSVERNTGKDTELTATDLLGDLGQHTPFLGLWFLVRYEEIELLSVSFKFSHVFFFK